MNIHMEKKKILVVDDDATVLKSVCRLLVHAGFSVMQAMDGMRATQLIKQEKPDLIIMDLHIPAGTGHTVATRAKKDYKTTDIPIIVMSGSGNDDDVKMAKEWGVARYIVKPFNTKELLETVTDIISRS